MSRNAGIDNALKMREMFRAHGESAYFTYEHPDKIHLAVGNKVYKFNNDGTYKSVKANTWLQRFLRLFSS